MRWILVANASNAQLVQQAGEGDRLERVRQFEHQASRLPTSRIARDRAGWARSPTQAGGSPFLPASDPHRHEQERFAAELARFLEDAARHDRFGRLDVFAVQPFLGHLRAALGSGTRRRLGHECGVDLSRVGWAELGPRIEHELERHDKAASP